MSKSPRIDLLAERVKKSRAQIANLERKIIEDREAINAEVEHLFPNGRRGLTPRQKEILLLVRKGKANKEIAEACNISVRTVKFHVSCLLAIFGKANRYELIDAAQQIGDGK